jgi:hypothetical protein
MADQIVSQPDHGEKIIGQDGFASQRLQLFFDDITRILTDLTTSSGGTIEPSNFDPSSVIYRPSVGTDILPAVINENEFLGRLPGGEIEGLDFTQSWSFLGNGSGNVTLNQVGGAVNFTVESNLSTTMFRVDGSNNRVGIALGNLSATDGLVHILNSVAGGGLEGPVEANTDGDDLVLEHDFNGGMSILNGSDSYGNIYFGSPSWGNAAGNLWFLHDKAAGGSANESISSITDSAGKARFNFTPPPTVIVGQNVTIAGFVTNTDYNGTFTVLATGSGYIEVASGPFSISSVTNSGGTARFNFSGITVTNGDIVEIAAFVVNTAYNGTFAITATDGTSYFETVTAFGSDEQGEFSHYVQWGTNEAGGNFFVIGDGSPTFGVDILGDTFFHALNDTLDGSTTGLFINPDQDQFIDFQVNTFGSAPFLRVDSAADRLGISTTSLAPDQGTVHIIEGDTGATALSSGDLLIFEFLGGGNGISFLSENVSQGRICYSDPEESNRAIFQYNHFEQSGVGTGNDFGFQFYLSNFTNEVLRINGTEGVIVNVTNDTNSDFTVRAVNHDSLFKCDVSGGGRVGISNSGILPSHGLFHVISGDAVVAPDGNYDEIVAEGSGQAGITILGGAASESGIAWGANGLGGTAGLISMVPSTWLMNLQTNAVSRLKLSPGECVFNDTGADTDFRVESDNSQHMLIVDAGQNRVGISNASVAPTDGMVHLIDGGLAGSVTASSVANTLVVESNAAAAGMTLICATNGLNYLVFGDGNSAGPGGLRYSHSTNEMIFFANSIDILWVKPSGVVVNEGGLSSYDFRHEADTSTHLLFSDATGSGRVSISDASLAGTDGLLHLIQGALAGTITASANADTLVLESTGAMGLSLLADEATGVGNVAFGNPTDGNLDGYVEYTHSTRVLVLGAAGGDRLTIDSTKVSAANNLGFAGRLDANTTTVTGTTHTAGDEHVILVDDDTAGAAVTVTLPTAATADTIYHIKKLGSTANVTVDGNGAETIDGATTAVLRIYNRHF